MSYSNISKMNFEVSEEQKIFLDKIDRLVNQLEIMKQDVILTKNQMTG